jgi:sensor histidine kinase YesM
MNNQEIQSRMKSRGLIDFYLPTAIAYHLKIVLGSIALTMFFSLIWRGRLIHEDFWFVLIIMIVQLEIFMAIAVRLFKKEEMKPGASYRNRIVTRLIKFYLLVLIISIVILFMTILLSMALNNQSLSVIFQHFLQRELKGFFLSWLIGISLGSLFFFYMEWTKSLKREQKLREEKLIFQYETLKNQVNPHFLFNSLNTLSSLVASDTGLSEIFIQKLSTIYRYILENRDVDFISLPSEMRFVKDYFFLQKIRDNGKIELTLPEETLDGYEILPISIQLLVENALKHNAATKTNPLMVNITLENGWVVVKNNLQPKMQMVHSSNLGLKNLKERVHLIMNKEVVVESSGDSFIVKIPVKRI